MGLSSACKELVNTGEQHQEHHGHPVTWGQCWDWSLWGTQQLLISCPYFLPLLLP